MPTGPSSVAQQVSPIALSLAVSAVLLAPAAGSAQVTPRLGPRVAAAPAVGVASRAQLQPRDSVPQTSAPTSGSRPAWRLTVAGGRSFSHESRRVYEGSEFAERIGGAEDGQHYFALGGSRAFRLPDVFGRLAPSRPLEFRAEALFANARSRLGSHYMLDTTRSARHALRDETYGLSAAVAWPVGRWGRVQPYLLGGLGVYHKRLGSNPDHGADEVSGWVSTTTLGWQAGFGLQTAIGSRALFIEARRHQLRGEWTGSNFTPLAVGLRF